MFRRLSLEANVHAGLEVEDKHLMLSSDLLLAIRHVPTFIHNYSQQNVHGNTITKFMFETKFLYIILAVLGEKKYKLHLLLPPEY